MSEVLIQVFTPEELQQLKDRNRENIWYGCTILSRIILTLFSFEGLFFVYNIIIEYIILFPILFLRTDNFLLQFILSILYILFALITSNILLIPTYELISFPFLRYKDPFIHLESFLSIKRDKELEEDSENKSNIVVNCFLVALEIIYTIAYLVGLIFSKYTFKDIVEIIIFCFFFLYYLVIILCYFCFSCYFLCPLICKVFDKKYLTCSGDCAKTICCCNCFNINDDFINKKAITDINLMSHVINPLIKSNYAFQNENERNNYKCEETYDLVKTFIKIIFLILSIVGLIIILVLATKIDFWAVTFFIILYIIISTLTLITNFPMCYRNRRTTGKNCGEMFDHFKNPLVKYKPRIRFPVLIPAIRCFSNGLILIVSLFFVFKILFGKDKEDQTNFKDLKPSDQTINQKELLLPNLCYSSVHNIPIYLYMPFINDAYYYRDDNKFSSFSVDNYRNLFYNNVDDGYDIKVIGNLIENNAQNKDRGVKMIQYNVQNKKNKVTILSIKGTSYKKDIFLDAQLYFPSILLNLLSTFSTLDQQKELNTFKLIEYALSIPYRIFYQFLIIDDYLEELIKAYEKNKQNFYPNVVIVGHSLGGGLAKIFGRLMRKQAISLSGPGVNAFHSLWEYQGDSDNFELTAIDLIPDMDLVPRVEISGGTLYRILCMENPLDCHSKELSLCEVLIMCRHPNYDVYCNKFTDLNNEKIKNLYDSSEFNKIK